MKSICTSLFIVRLCIIAKYNKQIKYSYIEQWLLINSNNPPKTVLCSYKINEEELYGFICRDFQGIFLCGKQTTEEYLEYTTLHVKKKYI